MEPKIVTGTDMTGIKWFDSVDSVMELAATTTLENLGDYMRTEDTHSTKRHGVSSPDKVRRVIRDGWPDGVARTMTAFDTLKFDTVSTDMRRRKKRGDQGDWLDMQAVYSGNLSKAWTRTGRSKRVASRTINLLVDLAISWETDADVLFWRGAAALYLSDALTRCGYSVGIIACNAGMMSVDGAPYFAHLITVKQPDMPLNLDNLAATICLPGFFRVPCFHLLRTHHQKISGSLSRPRTFRNLYADQIDELRVMDGFGEISNKETARAFIENVMHDLEQQSMSA